MLFCSGLSGLPTTESTTDESSGNGLSPFPAVPSGKDVGSVVAVRAVLVVVASTARGRWRSLTVDNGGEAVA